MREETLKGHIAPSYEGEDSINELYAFIVRFNNLDAQNLFQIYFSI